jgi:hypothetical protein
MTARVHKVARELKAGALDKTGASKLHQTRMDVVRGWKAVRDVLVVEGRNQLADEVNRFVSQMPPARTEKQFLAQELVTLARRSRSKDQPLDR